MAGPARIRRSGLVFAQHDVDDGRRELMAYRVMAHDAFWQTSRILRLLSLGHGTPFD